MCLRRTARVGYWCTIVPVWKLLARCCRPGVAAENNGVRWTLVGLSRSLTLISRLVGAADRAGRGSWGSWVLWCVVCCRLHARCYREPRLLASAHRTRVLPDWPTGIVDAWAVC